MHSWRPNRNLYTFLLHGEDALYDLSVPGGPQELFHSEGTGLDRLSSIYFDILPRVEPWMLLYSISSDYCNSTYCIIASHFKSNHLDLSVPRSSRQIVHFFVASFAILVGGSSSPSLLGQKTKLVLIIWSSISSIVTSHYSGYENL